MKRTVLKSSCERPKSENCGTLGTFPKKLLTSKTWKSRNDSSKMNAILHPEDHNNTPRMKYDEHTKGNVTKKCCLSSNNCYCREHKDIPRPSLIPRPARCVSKTKIGKKVSIQDLKRSSSSCVCTEKDSKRTESLRERTSKMKQCRISQFDVDLGFSNQRLKYEEYHEDQKDKYLQEVEHFKEKERRRKLSAVQISENEYYINEDERKRKFLDDEYGSSTDINTILGTQKYGTDSLSAPQSSYTENSEDPYFGNYLRNIPSSSHTRTDNFKFTSDLENVYLPDIQYKDFQNFRYGKVESSEFGNYPYVPDRRSKTSSQNVPKFRKSHFFETHNIGRLAETIEDHICIHQFILNERMLPEPLHKDVFGRSLCKICEKPMEGTTDIEKGYFQTSSKPTKSTVRNLSKCLEYGLSPKLIHIGNEKSRIELVLGKNDLDALNTVVKKLKRTEYCNSLALRQQKMRLI